MSEKLVEIAKATSKGVYHGMINERYIDIYFQNPSKRGPCVGFRYGWDVDIGLSYKGYFSFNNPKFIGFWVCKDNMI